MEYAPTQKAAGDGRFRAGVVKDAFVISLKEHGLVERDWSRYVKAHRSRAIGTVQPIFRESSGVAYYTKEETVSA